MGGLHHFLTAKIPEIEANIGFLGQLPLFNINAGVLGSSELKVLCSNRFNREVFPTSPSPTNKTLSSLRGRFSPLSLR
jgi:hypothetical protein